MEVSLSDNRFIRTRAKDHVQRKKTLDIIVYISQDLDTLFCTKNFNGTFAQAVKKTTGHLQSQWHIFRRTGNLSHTVRPQLFYLLDYILL